MTHGIHNVDRCTGQGEPSNVWNQRGFQPPRHQKKTRPCKQALKFGQNQWVVREQADLDAPRWACLSHHLASYWIYCIGASHLCGTSDDLLNGHRILGLGGWRGDADLLGENSKRVALRRRLAIFSVAERKLLLPSPGGFDDGGEAGELRPPSQDALCLLRAGHQNCWVP